MKSFLFAIIVFMGGIGVAVAAQPVQGTTGASQTTVTVTTTAVFSVPESSTTTTINPPANPPAHPLAATTTTTTSVQPDPTPNLPIVPIVMPNIIGMQLNIDCSMCKSLDGLFAEGWSPSNSGNGSGGNGYTTVCIYGDGPDYTVVDTKPEPGTVMNRGDWITVYYQESFCAPNN